MTGRVQLFHDGVVRGPYTKTTREYWLRRVLAVQQKVRELGPDDFRTLELISLAELHEIRRIWLYEKHQFDDTLPGIYQKVMEEPFPSPPSDDNLLGADDWQMLRDVCGEDEDFFQLQAGLLDIEREFRGMSRRTGIYVALEERLQASQYASEEEAVAIRQEEERRRKQAIEGRPEPTVVQPGLFEQCDSAAAE
ncbi:MAG: hypothetical protein ACC628_10030 [Pirellulaceae bacterium]